MGRRRDAAGPIPGARPGPGCDLLPDRNPAFRTRLELPAAHRAFYGLHPWRGRPCGATSMFTDLSRAQARALAESRS